MKTYKILLLEDDPFDMELIRKVINSKLDYKFEFKWVETKTEYIKALDEFRPDIILSDYNLKQFSGMEALQLSLDTGKTTPFIIVTGALKEEVAADSIKSGAWDYIVKGRLHRLPGAIQNALRLKSEKLKSSQAKEELLLYKEKAGMELRLLSNAVGRAPVSIIITDMEGNIVYVNPKFEEITGYKAEEVIGKNPRIIKSGKHNQDFYNTLWSTILNNKEYVGEMVNRKKNGELYWAHVSISAITDDRDNIEHFVAIQRDITPEKKSQIKIKENENLYRTIFSNTGTASFICDARQVIILANTKFEELSGYSKTELHGKLSWPTFIAPPEKERVISWFDDFPKNLNNFDEQKEFTFITKSKQKRNVIITAAYIPGTEKYIISLLDITDRKAAEKEIISAMEKAEESNRLKSAFLATISHELRTPLNAIIGFSEFIDESMDKGTIIELSKIINKSGNDLLNIIEEIFEISLLQTKEAKLFLEEFNLNDLFLSLQKNIEFEKIRRNKKHLKTIYQPDIKYETVEIKTDKSRVSRLLINLITNAIEFTNEGRVTYGFYIKNNGVGLFVKDTGIGIPEEKTEIIFNPFSQGENSRTREHGGVGLGLTICKEISRLLDGRLWFDSVTGKGTTFYFSLNGVVVNVQEKKSIPAGIPGSNGIENKTILIVEDVESNYRLLDKYLSLARAKTLWAQNGQESVDMVKKNSLIDLILMDIKMPVMDGIEAAKIIRGLYPHIPIIAQTAHASKDDYKRILSSGIDDCIVKPIRKETLYKTINKFLES